MTIKSLTGKKFLLVTAAAVLGFGVAASFVVPSANASQGSTTTAVSTVEAPSAEAPSAEAPSTEATGIDCNNGLDASGAQCDGGPAANPNDNGSDVQSGSENGSETTSGVDGDNVQSQN
ncbi:MAG TPA: hypothetical protein VGJ85_03390 [Candidatus Nanopelagicaceae bacterium]|jgi:hypothetical protein